MNLESKSLEGESLKGKTLFITGASRGIGLAIGLRAARDGANVAIAAKTAKRMAKIQAGQKVVDEDEEAKAAAKQQILLIAGGGTLASTAFFYRNIQRLFIKFTSGGEDSGYNSIPEPGSKRAQAQANRRGRGKPAPEPEPEPSLVDGAKKWAEFAFGRKL